MPGYHVLEARYVGGHVVWLRFRDGTAGEIDLAPALRGPVFEPLRDPLVFRNFAIHSEFHTLVWPNGADFAPEFLHDNCGSRRLARLSILEESDDAVARSWAEELERRSRDVAEGRIQTIPWETARSEILRELEQRRAGRTSS